MQCDDKDKAEQPSTEGKFTFESAQDVKTLVGYLRAITDGFEAGSMRFTRKDLDLVLSPKGLVGFAVEAKGKEGRMKLTLKFHWRENVEAKEPEEDTLSITPGDAR